MSLVIPDQSYIAASDADAYFTLRGNTTWSGASTPNKEAALVRASDYIDIHYKFKGEKADCKQARQWPRISRDRWWPSLGIGLGMGYGSWVSMGLWMAYAFPGLFFVGDNWLGTIPGITDQQPWTITTNTVSANAGDNSINTSANDFGSLSVGQQIKTTGFSNSANNATLIVVSATVGKIVVSGATLVTEAAGNQVTVMAVLPIPQQVQNATCELAVRTLSNGDLLPDVDPIPIIEEKVGPITTRYGTPYSMGSKRYPMIDQMLKGLTSGGGDQQFSIGRG